MIANHLTGCPANSSAIDMTGRSCSASESCQCTQKLRTTTFPLSSGHVVSCTPLDLTASSGAGFPTNADNPVADYTVVYAPYCTSDVHLGQQDTSYPPLEEGQEPLLIRHQGRANMQAVLDWTYANVRRPQKIFVTGSSAGAIPSPFCA